MRLGANFLCALAVFASCPSSNAFLPLINKSENFKAMRYQHIDSGNRIFQLRKSEVILKMAKKKASTKKKKSGPSSVGLKGFGSASSKSSPSSSTSSELYEIDRSKASRDFYDYVEKNGGGANLKRVALGHFPLGDTGMKIRGVVALKPIAKGELILSIPYEMALNLGQEGGDPTIPALSLLEILCENKKELAPYLSMLPKFMGDDCLGSTDFFSDKALSSLQFPIIEEETLKRRHAAKTRFRNDEGKIQELNWISDFNDAKESSTSTTITEEHLRYAVWLITSRVLTVQGAAGSNQAFRLMIPFIDMCNHDRSSSHILSGRATPGGTLKIIAGCNVEAGEQINICYGGGVAGNDRFIQDYGFLDWNIAGYDIVARQLLGRQRVIEGGGNTAEEREKVMNCLKETLQEQDEELLTKGGMDRDETFAVEFRLGVKKSLAKFQES